MQFDVHPPISQAKEQVDALFSLYSEPEDSQSSEEIKSAFEEMHEKLQQAFSKLNDDLFHSKEFNQALLEKIKFGEYYGIFILCPQLFEGLLKNEEFKEKLINTLLNPEAEHDAQKKTIFRRCNYLTYSKKYSDITANAQEKGALCRLMMLAFASDIISQKEILDHLTTERVSDTYIGPRPNDRYKYLDYLTEEVLNDTEFLKSLIIKDHEVFHHLPKAYQEPIKEDLRTIFYNSQDLEFFFVVFNFSTDESRENFLAHDIMSTLNLAYISKIPEHLLTTDLFLKSTDVVREKKLNHGLEMQGLEFIYSIAIDRVQNSRLSEGEKDNELYKIYNHMQKNNFLLLKEYTWDLIKTHVNELLA